MLKLYKRVYKATNKKTGKSYIGLSKHSLEHRRSEHLKDARRNSPTHFHRALRKYGADAFNWCTLYLCSSPTLTSLTERMMIKQFDTYQTGYNMTTGGESNWTKVVSDATRKKLSEAGKGRRVSQSTRKKMSQSSKGRIFTNSHREKLSQANKRRWQEGGNIGKKGKPCVVNGVYYPTCSEAIKQNNISGPTFRKWVKLGKNGAAIL